MSHAIYGNPCDSSTHKYDVNKCVFDRCQEGYYLKNKKCVSIPSLDYDDIELYYAVGIGAGVIAAIVIGIILLLSLILNGVLIVCICCCYERKNKKGEKDELYLKINNYICFYNYFL